MLFDAEVDFQSLGEGLVGVNSNTVFITKAVIVAPITPYDRLTSLSEEDRGIVLEALQEIWPYEEQEGDMAITQISFRLNPDSVMWDPQEADRLLQNVTYIRNIMVDVSTEGRAINDVNPEFKEAYAQLTARLKANGLQNPVPYSDLWEWYGKWSSGDLPTYRSRRQYITGLFKPIELRLRENLRSSASGPIPEPTGWPLVDRQLGGVRARLQSASTEEQFQTVGLLCREVLISLAQTVFDPDLHPPLDDVTVSKTDAKRMLDRYLAAELGGGSHTVARRHAKASLALANELQHERTAAFRKAALCAEATASLVNIIAILSGIRDPESGTAEL